MKINATIEREKILSTIIKLNGLYTTLENYSIGKENLLVVQDTIDLLYQIIEENELYPTISKNIIMLFILENHPMFGFINSKDTSNGF